MSRWICVDDIGSMETRTDQALIDSAPSIDIVRCGECKHENSCEHQVLLSTMWGEVEDTADIEYCSYGEREGE